tara:strand:+ start:108 stop:941 length:834 start_codon:yes stop_codon:yes gene_type:complete
MEEDKIQYTTQTGETRVDVPNKKFARIPRQVENMAKKTTVAPKNYRKVKGDTILKITGIENFKSRFNKSVVVDVEPDQIYWLNDKNTKIYGMESPKLEQEFVDNFLKNKMGSAIDELATNLGVKKDFVQDTITKYKVNPNVLSDVIGRAGGAWLDPVSEVLEVALGKVGLKGVGTAWFKAEMLGLVAAAVAGVGAGVGAKVGPGMAKDLQKMMLPGYQQYIQPAQKVETIDAVLEGLETFTEVTQFLPSVYMDEKLKEKTGKYGGEWMRAGIDRLSR